jgi:DNA-binding NarL/FixJ family response regulator
LQKNIGSLTLREELIHHVEKRVVSAGLTSATIRTQCVAYPDRILAGEVRGWEACMSIRVLIVDDQILTRQGLKGVLQSESDVVIVGEAETGGEALEKAISLRPDVVLMDLMGPGEGGIDATRAIRHRCPETQVLVLTSYADHRLLRKSAEAGAVGYVLKDIPPADLVNGIRAVHTGKTAVNSVLCRRLLEDFFNNNGASPALAVGHLHGLTHRETEVLVLVAQGCSDKEIATKLFLSESTIKSHLRAIFHKLKLRNRAHGAAFVAERTLLPKSK